MKRILISSWFFAGLAIAPSAWAQASCTADPAAVQGVDSVLYDQRSIEHALIAEETYRAATLALRTASLEPGDALMADQPLPKVRGKRRLAVILDVDETVLDNSPGQAFLVKNGLAYCDPAWNKWVASRAATPVPGAVAFTRAAARANIKVFYVTNRSCLPTTPGQPCSTKADTMAVMARLGFARADDPSAFLLLGEKPDWTSDKSSRRAVIAGKYRVIMMMGDQLTDFVSPATAKAIWTELTDPVVSGAIAALPPGNSAYARYRAMVGKRWFVLPNSQYGFSFNRFSTGSDRLAAIQAADLADPPPPAPAK
jgi:5'-nucleotidase (lipoprotein e(P4) family)